MGSLSQGYALSFAFRESCTILKNLMANFCIGTL